MNVAQAQQILETRVGDDEPTIRAAYRRMLMIHHPDTGTGEVLPAQLQAARDVLLKALAEPLNQVQEIACKMCGGSGRVGTGFGAPCASCRGTGNANG